jgi:hypothetical protein
MTDGDMMSRHAMQLYMALIPAKKLRKQWSTTYITLKIHLYPLALITYSLCLLASDLCAQRHLKPPPHEPAAAPAVPCLEDLEPRQGHHLMTRFSSVPLLLGKAVQVAATLSVLHVTGCWWFYAPLQDPALVDKVERSLSVARQYVFWYSEAGWQEKEGGHN